MNSPNEILFLNGKLRYSRCSEAGKIRTQVSYMKGQGEENKTASSPNEIAFCTTAQRVSRENRTETALGKGNRRGGAPRKWPTGASKHTHNSFPIPGIFEATFVGKDQQKFFLPPLLRYPCPAQHKSPPPPPPLYDIAVAAI